MEPHPFGGPQRLALALASYAESAAQNEYLRAILERLPIIAFRVDPEGRITESSGMARDNIVARRGDSTGLFVADAYSDVPEVLGAIARAQRGETVELEVRIDGSDYRAAYEPTSDGSVIGVAVELRPLARGSSPEAGPDLDAVSVLVVEPHERIRAGLAAQLREAGLNVSTSASGDAADAVDVVVLGDGAGVEPLLRIRDAHPDMCALVLAVHPTPQTVAWWQERGANGVIDALAPGEDVAEAVGLVARYGVFVADASHLRPASGAALSPRQRQVACLIAKDLGRAEIAQELGIAPGAVSALTARARARLGLRTDAGLALHAVREGWVPLAATRSSE